MEPENSNKRWEEGEVEYLCKNYADTQNSEIADDLERTKMSVAHKARRLGLEKGDNFTTNIIDITETPNFDDEFSHFISGFVAGEGHFGVREPDGEDRKRFCLQITLTESDADILYDIKNHFDGIGNIYHNSARKESWNPEAQYLIQSIGDLVGVVVPFFDKYGLRNTDKRRQYEQWRSELIEYTDRKI